MMFITIGLVLLIGFLFRILVPYRWVSFRAAALLKKIPGPKEYPILGNKVLIHITPEGMLPLLTSFAKKYGSIYRLCLMGHSTVVLTDPTDIERVMGNPNIISKSTDYSMLHAWLGTGLLTSTGEKWRKHRKILTPAFHFKILESYIPLFHKHSVILIERMRALINEKYIEINNLITLCTLDIICETSMGVGINAQKGCHSDYLMAVKRMSEIFHYRQLSPWLYHPWSYAVSSLGREEAKTIKTLHKLTKKVIAEKKENFEAENLHDDMQICKPNKHRTFLDILLGAAKEQELSDTDIQEEVDTFLFEGHDTTSAAISWLLYLLGCHKDVQDKVIDELREIFGDSDRDPDYRDLQNMKYLEQAIKEALRLYPSVPAFARTLETDFMIKDYVIPSGTNIAIIPFIIHRNPDVFPEPESFNPDHFKPECAQHRHPYAYLPFSAGSRNCIGQRFALLEEKVVVSRILRNFRLTSLDKQEDLELPLELILRPKFNLRIKLEPLD